MSPAAGRGAPACRGFSTVGMAVLLLALMGLAAGWAAQALLTERRSMASELRLARATQAAAAGLAWGQARLNAAPGLTPAECPALGPGGLRARWTRAAASGPPRPAGPAELGRCSLDADGLRCHCGLAPEPASPPDDDAAGFVLRLAPDPAADPGFWLDALGCDPLAACAGPPSDHAARHRQRQRLDWVPAFAPLPPAALVAGGRVRLCGPSRLEGGADSPWLLQAGGAVEGLPGEDGAPPSACPDGQVGTVELHGPAGSPMAALVLAGDAALARWAGEPRGFSLALLGREPEAYARPPGQAWPDGTAADVAARLAAGAALLRVERPTTWPDGLVLGSAQEPVLVVVQGGSLRLEGVARLHGLLLVLDGPMPGGGVLDIDGALVSRGDVIAEAPLRLRHDPALLARLAWRAARLLPRPDGHEEP